MTLEKDFLWKDIELFFRQVKAFQICQFFHLCKYLDTVIKKIHYVN